MATISSKRDIRKFLVDGGTVAFPTLTDKNSHGNFKTIDSLCSWLKLNSSSNKAGVLRGSHILHTSDGYVNNNYNFYFNSKTTLFGDGASISIDPAVYSAYFQNVTIENVDFDFTNITNIYVYSNVKFVNCNFTLSTKFITIDGAAENIEFDNCIFSGDGSSIITLNSITNKNIEIHGCKFVWTNVATLPTPPVWVTTDYVNNGNGCIYNGMSYSGYKAIKNFKVQDCEFLYQPASAGSSRYSWINFEKSGTDGYIDSIYIERNKFLNYYSNTTSDRKAAIALIATASANPSALNGVQLSNCFIRENYCDNEQCIVLSGKENVVSSVTSIYLPQFNFINVEVSKNTCWVIGFLGARVSTTDALTNRFLNNQGIRIQENSCKYILTTDYTGNYYENTNALVNYESCDILISENNCASISLAHQSKSTSNNSLKINNNNLTAYDVTDFGLYTQGTYGLASLYVGMVAILTHTQTSSVNSPVIITDNIINDGYYYGISGYFNYYYDRGIHCLGDSIISNNIIKSIKHISALAIGILTDGYSINITNNKIYRNGNAITSYILCANPTDGYCSGIIANNYLDSQTINGSIPINQISVPITSGNIVVEKNTNHIQYQYVQLGTNDGYYSTNMCDGYYINHNATGSIHEYGNSGQNTFMISDTTNTQKSFSKIISLSSIMPTGAKLLNLTLNTFVIPTGTFDSKTGNQQGVFIDLISTITGAGLMDISTPMSGIISTGKKISASFAADSIPKASALTTMPQSILIDLTSLTSADYGKFVVNNNRAIDLLFYVNYWLNAAAYYFSPIQVTYTW